MRDRSGPPGTAPGIDRRRLRGQLLRLVLRLPGGGGLGTRMRETVTALRLRRILRLRRHGRGQRLREGLTRLTRLTGLGIAVAALRRGRVGRVALSGALAALYVLGPALGSRATPRRIAWLVT
ncbi:hypothetical protein, partial [Streptomyces sp. NPDC047981]|uniref:hypothetical protein n=1 Tax=Streptomyces sp. NPDC047981 TaxID=3154610 RepID=UPI003429854C